VSKQTFQRGTRQTQTLPQLQTDLRWSMEKTRKYASSSESTG